MVFFFFSSHNSGKHTHDRQWGVKILYNREETSGRTNSEDKLFQTVQTVAFIYFFLF